jgi:dUTP pyrophosphatase
MIINTVGTKPVYANPGDAGADIYATSHDLIERGETKLVTVDTAIAIPDGYVGMMCSRSGLALKHSVFVLNAPGIIDSGYRGKLGVILHNAGKNDFEIAPGERIAQLVLVPYESVIFHTIKSLDQTERGSNGFGSTGV